MNSHKIIEESSTLANKLIQELFKIDSQNKTFSQLGIINGKEEVDDWMSHGEEGLALEHLLYMVHESDIKFPKNKVQELHNLAKYMNIRNHYTKENQLNLTEEQKSNIYNSI